MRVQRAANWRFWPCVGQQARKVCEIRANFMGYMFIRQRDPSISNLLEMPKYLWPYACFAYSKSLEIKICGFSWQSPGMDGKAATSGDGWKEDQLVGWCYNYFFPCSFTALGSRHRRNNSLNLSLLFCTPDPSVFLWQKWITNIPQTLILWFFCTKKPWAAAGWANADHSGEFLEMHEEVWRISIQPQCYSKPFLEPSLAWINGTAKSTWQDGNCNLDTNQFIDHGPCMKISSWETIFTLN